MTSQEIKTVTLDYRQYLSPQEISEIEHEVTRLEHREAAGIDALKIVQRNRGWISEESLIAIADLLTIPVAQLEGVATFYNLIYRQPVGKYVIHLCDSVSCYLNGYTEVLTALRQELKIEFGQTTEDKMFTLLSIACLGGCDKSPAMMIGDQHYDKLTAQKAVDIVRELRHESMALEVSGE